MLTPDNIRNNILRSSLEQRKKISRKIIKPPEITNEETTKADEAEDIFNLAKRGVKMNKKEKKGVKEYIEADLLDESTQKPDSEKKDNPRKEL
ncbi:MAG: hypothetical protein NTW06_03245 [Candidatus Falkowbacteria bacterium]|nr:hypothetical protein [Candidatus Falkowbacteria bacterium]